MWTIDLGTDAESNDPFPVVADDFCRKCRRALTEFERDSRSKITQLAKLLIGSSIGSDDSKKVLREKWDILEDALQKYSAQPISKRLHHAERQDAFREASEQFIEATEKCWDSAQTVRKISKPAQ